MKFSIGDKVTLLKEVVINKNIKVLSGALGEIIQVINLSKFYGQEGKTYSVCFEGVIEIMVFESSLGCVKNEGN